MTNPRFALFLLPALLSATPISFTGSQGALAAFATFDTSGSNLLVTLTNTASGDVTAANQILTGVFFDFNGPSLGKTSAFLNTGSSVVGNGGLTGPGVGEVGGEFAYSENLSAAVTGATRGISSAGLNNTFLAAHRFPGNNLQGPANPSLIQYGITTAGDNPATADGDTRNQGLINNSVIFTLSGLPQGFNPAASVTNVIFQFGTTLAPPRFAGTVVPLTPVPEPSSFVLLGTAMIALAALRRKFANT